MNERAAAIPSTRRSPALLLLTLAACASPPPSPPAPLPGSAPSRAPAAPSVDSVEIPAGTFQMGSDADGEGPIHPVSVSRFRMDRTEVTVAAYAACVAASACAPPRPPPGERRPRCNGADRPQHPVNCVDWHEAKAHCAWRGARLPTEEEWEYAARGTDGRRFPWGPAPPGPTLLNACDEACIAAGFPPDFSPLFAGRDGWDATAPVGSYPAGRSPFGLDDMAGNVEEWTQSGASPSYRFPRDEARRVLRGGSWKSRGSEWIGTTFRQGWSPEVRDDGLGFRCASDG